MAARTDRVGGWCAVLRHQQLRDWWCPGVRMGLSGLLQTQLRLEYRKVRREDRRGENEGTGKNHGQQEMEGAAHRGREGVIGQADQMTAAVDALDESRCWGVSPFPKVCPMKRLKGVGEFAPQAHPRHADVTRVGLPRLCGGCGRATVLLAPRSCPPSARCFPVRGTTQVRQGES